MGAGNPSNVHYITCPIHAGGVGCYASLRPQNFQKSENKFISTKTHYQCQRRLFLTLSLDLGGNYGTLGDVLVLSLCFQRNNARGELDGT